MDNLFEDLIRSDNPLESARLVVAPYCKQKLQRYILECNKCNLQFEKKVCFGNANANILIINDIATDNTDLENYFQYILDNSNIDQSDLFIINSVSCVCKRKEKDKYVPVLPTYEVVKECKHFVDYAVKFVNPRIIIVMGATALNQYCLQDVELEKWVDENPKCYFYNTPTIVTYSINKVFELTNYNKELAKEKLHHIVSTLDNSQQYINSIKIK